MTNTNETLTEDERAHLEYIACANKGVNATAKLLRLYDAALARAEAAERKQELGHALVQSTEAELERTRAAATKVHAADVESLSSARDALATAKGDREACEKHLSIVIEARDELARDLATARSRIAELEAELAQRGAP